MIADERTIVSAKDDQKSMKFTASLTRMVHLVAIGLPVFIIWLAKPGSSLFSWHPILMTFAFSFLMVEAILMFSPHSSLIPTLPRATKAFWHWVLQTTAIILALIGFIVIFVNKNLHGKSHFVSWHGTFGLVVIILILVQAFQGVSVLYPKFNLLSKKLSERKVLHALLGTLVFALGSATIVLGFFSNWFVKNSNEATWWGSVLSILAMTGVIMGQVVKEFEARKKSVKETVKEQK